MDIRPLKPIGLVVGFMLLEVIHGALQKDIQMPSTYYKHMISRAKINITNRDTTSGYILSPRYPHPFPINASSYVTLMGYHDESIDVRIVFEDLQMESSNFCRTEALSISCNRYRVLTVCGSSIPEELILNDCRDVSIIFSSDAFNSGRNRGFKIRFQFVNQDPRNTNCNSLNYFRCRNRRCIPKRLKCNHIDDCGDASDEDETTPCARLPTIPYSIDYDCGISSLSHEQLRDPLENRIVGGKAVRRDESWPFQVSIQSVRFEFISQICGGILIHPLYVLSAAHCFWDPLSQFKLLFGSQDLQADSRPDVNNHVQVRYIRAVHLYPSPHDIALIELNAPVVLTSHVRPACLPYEHEPMWADQMCHSTGFGSTRGSGDTYRLKRVSQIVKHASECEAPYTESFSIDDYSKICAKSVQGHGVCHGDSGGPLICPDNARFKMQTECDLTLSKSSESMPLMSEDEYNRTKANAGPPIRFTVYGVLSSIAGGKDSYAYCGFARVPTIYTRVSVFIEWILSIMFRDIRFSSNVKDRNHLLDSNGSTRFGYMFRGGSSRHPNFTKPMTIFKNSTLNLGMNRVVGGSLHI